MLTFFTAAFGPRAQFIPFLTRLVLGLIFIAAGALKIGHAADLAATITSFALGIPGPLTAFIAVALPPFEILLGVYVLGGWFLTAGAGMATALLGAFAAVIASVVARGIHASCGCFGPAESTPATWWDVARDLILVAVATYLFWWSIARKRQIS